MRGDGLLDNSPLHWRPRRAGQVQGQGRVATETGGRDNQDESESDLCDESDENGDGEGADNDDESESDDDHEVKTRGRLRTKVTGVEVVMFAGDWKGSG